MSGCKGKCRHELVWERTPNGKFSQVRRCETAKFAAEVEAAKKGLGSVDPFTLDLVEKALGGSK